MGPTGPTISGLFLPGFVSYAAITHVKASVEGDAGLLRLANAEGAGDARLPRSSNRCGNFLLKGCHVRLAHAAKCRSTAVAARDGAGVRMRAADEDVAVGNVGGCRNLRSRVDHALFPNRDEVAGHHRNDCSAVIDHQRPRKEIVVHGACRPHMVVTGHVRT